MQAHKHVSRLKPLTSKGFGGLITTLAILLLLPPTASGQIATRHHIPPSPWQYWSDAIEIVVTTQSTNPVNVTVRKSDGTFMASLVTRFGDPAVYRFPDAFTTKPLLPLNTLLKDAGMIVEANTNIYVNIRNVTSDNLGQFGDPYIKGNASMVSLGNQGLGMSFRIAYYRKDQNYLKRNNVEFGPIYSVMALENNTRVTINGNLLVTLKAGESYLFQAPQGSLLQSDKLVTVASGAAEDYALQRCGDGVVEQLPPLKVLGKQYLIVRGMGLPSIDAIGNEQTNVIATVDGTKVQLRHFDSTGTEILPAPTPVTLNAGEILNFHQGDTKEVFSSTFVDSDKDVAVYYGTGSYCEVDMSVVPALSSCAGSDTIQTTHMLDFSRKKLSYFGFIITEHANEKVYVNDVDIETLVPKRKPIGNTGYYMIRFLERNFNNPDKIVVRSKRKVNLSLIQDGGGFTMASYFSVFNEIPDIPTMTANQCDKKLLKAAPGMTPYQWFRNDTLIAGADSQEYWATQSGYYSYKGTLPCGFTSTSIPMSVSITPIGNDTTRLNASICDNEKYKGYDKPGFYTERYAKFNGCGDSVVLLNLSVSNRSFSSIQQTICNGSSYLGYTRTGVYKDTLLNASGCDSIRTLDLTVLNSDPVRTDFTPSICEGQTFKGYDKTGIYTERYPKANGCGDSIVTVNLTVKARTFGKVVKTICAGQSFLGYTRAGVFIDTITNAAGCDSVRTVELNVLDTTTLYTALTGDVCEGESFKGYNKTGVYVERYPRANGCGDSIVTVSLNVRSKSMSNITRIICEGDIFLGYARSGNYVDTLLNHLGCDSIRNLSLVVIPKTSVNLKAAICQSEYYKLPNGTLVDEAGTYKDTLKNFLGCDSLIRTVELTVKENPVLLLSKSNDINCTISISRLKATGGSRFLWSPSATLSNATIANPVANPQATTTYTVQSISNSGCVRTDSIQVLVKYAPEDERYLVPNAFTPNGDGVNDCFSVRHWGPVSEFRLDVFDRWGHLVFSSTDVTKCWDGTYKGKVSAQGNYVYQAYSNGPCGPIYRKGLVTLIR